MARRCDPSPVALVVAIAKTVDASLLAEQAEDWTGSASSRGRLSRSQRANSPLKDRSLLSAAMLSLFYAPGVRVRGVQRNVKWRERGVRPNGMFQFTRPNQVGWVLLLPCFDPPQVEPLNRFHFLTSSLLFTNSKLIQHVIKSGSRLNPLCCSAATTMP